MLKNLIVDLSEWWATVAPEFAFLLALPFAIAAAGLLGDAICRSRGKF